MKSYYTISNPSGMLLNIQKTDFNVKNVNFARFPTEEEAKEWIEKNNNRFISLFTKKPVTLFINKHL